MVYALPIISKVGAEYSKQRQRGCDLFVIWNIQIIITITKMPIQAENFFGSMLMTPIRTIYLTVNNPTDIWHIIHKINICKFFSISLREFTAEGHFCPIFALLGTRSYIILCSNNCSQFWKRGSSIEDKASSIYNRAYCTSIYSLLHSLLAPASSVYIVWLMPPQ